MKTSISAALAALFICAAQSASAEYVYSYQNTIPAIQYFDPVGGGGTSPIDITHSWSLLFKNELQANQTYGLSDVLAYNNDFVTDSGYSTFNSKDAQDQGGFVTSFYLRTNSSGQIDDWSIQYNLCGCQQTYSTSTSLDYVYINFRIGYTEGSTSNTSTWIETYLSSPFANGIPPGVNTVPEPETYAMMLAGLGLVGFVARRRSKYAA